MKVEVYSDVACPWCYIGADRFERALRSFPGGEGVEVVYRPYQLDPSAPQQAEPMMHYLARRFGAQARGMADRVIDMGRADGLVMDYDRGLAVNTLNAHRLTRFAEQKHGAAVQRALVRRLYEAHFSEGRDVGDIDMLATLAGEAGLDVEEARDYLVSGAGTEEVRDEIDEARQLGVRAVPTFVFDDKFVVEGAQPVNVFLQALEAASRDAA